MKYITGDVVKELREGRLDAIGHCANCQGVMGSGVALQIKREIPEAFKAYITYADEHGLELGSISFGGNVFNLHAQHLYGYNGARFVNYEALYNCLESMKKRIAGKCETIGFPYLMACDRAGGDWRIVEKMIEVVFENSGIEVVIVEFDQTGI